MLFFSIVDKGRKQVYLLNYHFVWIPKRRKPVLVGDVAKRLKELIKEKANELGLEILAMEVMPDHIHLFVSAPPTISPHQIMFRIKGYTSRILREEFPHLKNFLLSGHAAKVERKIEDLKQKLTRAFVKYCKAKGIGTVVVGKVKGIRKRAKYNKNANQKIHLTQLCLVCGNNKCGFSYHRDGVGAINLFKRFMEKVSGSFRLSVDGLTRPRGVRYSPSSSGWIIPIPRNPLL